MCVKKGKRQYGNKDKMNSDILEQLNETQRERKKQVSLSYEERDTQPTGLVNRCRSML